MRNKLPTPAATLVDFRACIIAYEQHLRTYAKPSSAKTAGQIIRQFQSWFEIHPFSRASVDAYVHMRLSQVAPITVKSEVRLLKTLLYHAIEIELIPALPFAKFPVVKAPRKRMIRTLTKGDIDKLLTAAEEPYRTLILLQSNTGMRISEALHLTWPDIDWDSGRIQIRPKDKWSPKNRESRDCWVKPHVLAALQALRVTSRSDWVFVNRYGRRMQLNPSVGVIKHIFERAGIYQRNIGSHLLRHSAATSLLNAGVPVTVVQKFLGHNDLASTMSYVHADANAVKDLRDKLPW